MPFLNKFLIQNLKISSFTKLNLNLIPPIPPSPLQSSSLFMAGHRQVISHISKGNQNILIIILLLPLLTGRQGKGVSARAFDLERLGVAPPL